MASRLHEPDPHRGEVALRATTIGVLQHPSLATSAAQQPQPFVEVVHAPGEGHDTVAAVAEAHREVIVFTARTGTWPRGSAGPRPSSSDQAGCSTISWSERAAGGTLRGQRQTTAAAVHSPRLLVASHPLLYG